MSNNEESLLSLLRIIRTEGVGPRTFYQLLNTYGSLKEILDSIPYTILRASRKNRNIKMASRDDVLREIELSHKNNAQIVPYFSELYPQELTLLDDAPPALTLKGNIEFLKGNKIAIVGARNASFNACRFTKHMSNELSKSNLVIVSGLARGIDTEAHKGSVEKGTIAVIAGGIDNIYPLQNKDLYQEIEDKGLIISEQPYGSCPKSENFPQRNRIIAGLSKAVIIVEASLKSGSLITAKFALEYGKEIMAVPGFPLDPRSQGTNFLIKQGAFLVENSRDVIGILNNDQSFSPPLFVEEKNQVKVSKSNYGDSELDEARSLILEELSYTPMSLEDLLLSTKIPLSLISNVILELELTGDIERINGSNLVKKYKYQDVDQK